MSTCRFLMTSALAALMASMARAQGPTLGVSVGGYFPTDGEIRDLVGKSFLQLGISPGVGIQKDKWSLRPEINFVSASGNGNRFTIIAIPLTFTMPLGIAGEKNVPYVQAGVGLTYFDYDIVRPGAPAVRHRDSGIGTVAHVGAGVVFGDRVKLSARYNMFSESDSFNFNGFELGLSWQFFRL